MLFRSNEDDPVSQALRGLVDSATTHDHQIALLWQALEQLVRTGKVGDCLPSEASLKECFEAEKLNQLIGK